MKVVEMKEKKTGQDRWCLFFSDVVFSLCLFESRVV